MLPRVSGLSGRTCLSGCGRSALAQPKRRNRHRAPRRSDASLSVRMAFLSTDEPFALPSRTVGLTETDLIPVRIDEGGEDSPGLLCGWAKKAHTALAHDLIVRLQIIG